MVRVWPNELWSVYGPTRNAKKKYDTWSKKNLPSVGLWDGLRYFIVALPGPIRHTAIFTAVNIIETVSLRQAALTSTNNLCFRAMF